MQFARFVSVALALIGSACAMPTLGSNDARSDIETTSTSVVPMRKLDTQEMNAMDLVPVRKLDAADYANMNMTLGPDAEFPATLLACRGNDCTDCLGFDLSQLQHQVCLSPGIGFVTTAISQPSRSGLGFNVFVGFTGCITFFQITEVNVCLQGSGVFSTILLGPGS